MLQNTFKSATETEIWCISLQPFCQRQVLQNHAAAYQNESFHF